MTAPQLIPVPFVVTRYRCPVVGCGRTRSSKRAIAEHIGRCWLNPAARSCKTCDHYREDSSEPEVGAICPEYCTAGVELAEGLPVGCPSWMEAQL